MLSAWKTRVFVLAIFAGLATTSGAHAQSTTITDGNFINYNGMTFTIDSSAGCAYSYGNAAGTKGSGTIGACALGSPPADLNAVMTAVSTTGGTTIEFLSATAGQPLLSYTSTGAKTNDDLTLLVDITVPTGTPVSTITGELTGSNSNQVTVTASVNSITTPSGASASGNLNANLLSGTSASAGEITASAGLTTFALQVDLRVSTASVASGTTLNLSNFSLTFNPTPEPASLAILGSAVGGLAVFRRRFKRGRASDVAKKA